MELIFEVVRREDDASLLGQPSPASDQTLTRRSALAWLGREPRALYRKRKKKNK